MYILTFQVLSMFCPCFLTFGAKTRLFLYLDTYNLNLPCFSGIQVQLGTLDLVFFHIREIDKYKEHINTIIPMVKLFQNIFEHHDGKLPLSYLHVSEKLLDLHGDGQRLVWRILLILLFEIIKEKSITGSCECINDFWVFSWEGGGQGEVKSPNHILPSTHLMVHPKVGSYGSLRHICCCAG